VRRPIKLVCCAVIAAPLLCLAPQSADAQRRQRTSRRTPAAARPPGTRVHATQRAVDASVPDDAAVVAAIAPYTAKVRALDAPVGKLVGELKKSGMGGGSLGNFVADAIRATAGKRLGVPVLLAVTNSGGLRKNSIAEGELRTLDIYELLPFENALVALDLTGEQLARFLGVIVAKRDAQSGARITYRTSVDGKNELISIKLGDSVANDRIIDPAAIYTIVTIDYLVKRGGDYAVLQEARNVRPLNVTIRDAVLDYLRTEAAAGRPIKSTLDGRFQNERGEPARSGGDEPK
jgi:2',3'-cyclic-nucleotide 2'-phosphodiesterase (5'-nucleotidase family)